MVHYLLTNKSMMKERNQANHRGHTSEKRDISRRASGRSFQGYSRRRLFVTIGDDSSMDVTSHEDLPVEQMWK